MRRLLGLTAVAALSGSVIANVAACVGSDPTGTSGVSSGDGSTPAPQGNQGSVDGPCYANGTCNVGLTCKAGRCVPEEGSNGGPDATNDTSGDANDDASDDANDAGSDGGRPVCNQAIACTRTIFATSTSYNGDLGGILGGDDKCNAAAGTPGAHENVKNRTYRAYLTDLDGGGPSRHVHGTMPYVLPNGVKVADNWDELLLQDGGIALASSISTNETGAGAFKGGTAAWTGASQLGTATGDDCTGWTSSSNGVVGQAGLISSTSSTWLSNQQDTCDQMRVLYCIEK